ncbi:hypothetical protein FRC08_008008 [Ceratobasidium sp. 394]|nr:hypothetical protein FRC08_008008 [Ceratobasidium sp. 394]
MPNITYDGSSDLNWYDGSTDTTVVYNLGDIAWTLCSTALVMIMIPGVGFFYSGLLRRKNALTITPMLALGGFAERSRLGPVALFVFVWSTIVYDPIARWNWNSNGWGFVMGGLDFAGGSPVHISSGTAALAISIYLGKRHGYGTPRLAYKPHNATYVILGTVFLWFGWFGFNGGSALSANLRAAQACIVTNLAASVGGITWMLWDYRLEKKWSAVGFCSGAVSGLVAITPGSGFVGAPAAVAFGVVSGTVCNFATQLKFLLKYDDCLDVFASHAVGGLVGNLLTGLFAQASVAAFDGFTNIPGGWIDHHYVQLGYQLADSVACFAYSFAMTTLILWIFHYIPGLHLRTTQEAEMIGVDDAEMGEFAYDYVEFDTEHGFPTERDAPVPKLGDASHRELGPGVGGREGPHHNGGVVNESSQESTEKA